VYENARVLSEDYDSTGRIMKIRGLPGAVVAKGFTRNCGCFLSARQRLLFPTSSLGTCHARGITCCNMRVHYTKLGVSMRISARCAFDLH